ncbi:LexA family transcriptional regulator [Pseudomonas sp. DTU_2021_1001937_2_SI_NGA_ILE_001]|uniref:XRE family transcriptional regulator n=1 Tax=Pseudomonas sp. DTU_2021_1001937_2_SI_NGA_ILE_001 TaxID=3077589 RepID=UPI0028FC27BD|nr:LexA family transcriptional regulator [Pseudomonas sp. DTU_2021_1001937_2_SI_NGA_ILE_001]WNW10107.1 LexA family transcriptional regulator [Pseudomonas sp. DTU_2021_1001937_2_SI_NGA_ILE_001]
MKKPVRTPLADWQLADADRLRDIYQRRVQESKARGDKPTLNQTEVGERCEWKSPQSAFSQYVNGKVALNLDALVRLAKALDFEPAEVSPTLAAGIARAADAAVGTGPIPGSDTPAANTPLPAGGEPAIDLDEHYAFVPQLTAKAAAGLGYENAHIESRSTLAFKREWLRFRGASEKHLVVIYADGESMWPTINSGDVLLVDKSKVDPAHQQVFVLGNSEGVIVKRLVHSPTGAWIIRSDNEDKDAYPDLALLRRDEDEHRIIGQVIWRGGDL